MGLFRKKQKENVVRRARSGPAGDLEQASQVVRSIIGQVGCPYRILEEMPAEELMKTYVDAYLKGRLAGYVPVLVPEDDVLDEYLGIMKDDGYTPAAALKEAEAMDGKAVLAGYLSGEDAAELAEEGGAAADDGAAGEDEGEGIDQFVSMFDFGTGAMKQTVLFEVPTENPWETVAYVPFGGWNECPAPAEMTAVCKYWFEKYQAIPAVITHDVLEFLVPKPVPAGEAMKAAWEHYAFCTDRVDQCTQTGTIDEVADCIARSKVWYFWWD